MNVLALVIGDDYAGPVDDRPEPTPYLATELAISVMPDGDVFGYLESWIAGRAVSGQLSVGYLELKVAGLVVDPAMAALRMVLLAPAREAVPA